MEEEAGVGKPKEAGGKATSYKLLCVCRDLQGRFEDFDVSLLVCHGSDDEVCDPACTEELYKPAVSGDKTLKIYLGMGHQIVGEPEENVELVFGDMVEWLRTRALSSKEGNSTRAAVVEGGV
ncbi:hypothetical protein Q3G72_005873 [Acer saccharum]|nr:hypothetical protein Q3G72_005873 [Acer saccharum]